MVSKVRCEVFVWPFRKYIFVLGPKASSVGSASLVKSTINNDRMLISVNLFL